MKKRLIFVLLVLITSMFFVGSQQTKITNEVYEELEDEEEVKVIVKVKDLEDVIENINEEKIKHVFEESIAVEVSEEKLSELNENPDVESVELVQVKKIFLQDSVGLINVTNVWNVQVSENNITGTDETICVLDTGVNFEHVDLAGKNKTCVIDCVGKACVENCSVGDDNGHGTHVAGIAGASGNINGVAINSGLIGVKVCDSAGGCSDDDIRAGIDWCVANSSIFNISVISMSLGGGQYDDYCDGDFLAGSINSAVGNNISVIVATGNTDTTYTNATAGIASPACVTNSTRVTATDKSDAYASYAFRHNNFLDILASPGSSINSTWKNKTYYVASGTSMATPHVAGAFALIRQFYRLQNNKVLTPSEIEDVLNSTGKQIEDSSSGLAFSRIDVYSAVLNLTENINLRINEIMYNPSGTDEGHEWLEIYTNDSVNISGWKFYEADTNHGLTLINGRWVIDGYAIIVDNWNLFLADYPTYNGTLIDSSWGTLSNSGENLSLKDGRGNFIDSVIYSDSAREGYSLELYNGIWYESHTINGTPGAANTEAACVNNWTEIVNGICNDGDYTIGWFNDTSGCYIETNKPENVTYNNSCDFDDNGVISNIDLVNDSSISNLSLTINQSSNLSQVFNGTQSVEFKDGGEIILEFDYNFSFEDLNLSALTMQKQSNESYGFVVVNGLDLSSQNQTKTVYVDRVLNGTGICIKDAKISLVSEVSETCEGANEFWLSCPGINGDYNCSLINNSYKITGLSHSGIKEQETYCGDGVVNGGETCSSCSADVGACAVEESSSSGGGGGGGGSSSSSSSSSTNTPVSEDNPIINLSSGTEGGDENLEPLNEIQTPISSGITGAVVGFVKTGRGIVSIVFILGISGAFVIVRKIRKSKEK